MKSLITRSHAEDLMNIQAKAKTQNFLNQELGECLKQYSKIRKKKIRILKIQLYQTTKLNASKYLISLRTLLISL